MAELLWDEAAYNPAKTSRTHCSARECRVPVACSCNSSAIFASHFENLQNVKRKVSLEIEFLTGG